MAERKLSRKKLIEKVALAINKSKDEWLAYEFKLNGMVGTVNCDKIAEIALRAAGLIR